MIVAVQEHLDVRRGAPRDLLSEPRRHDDRRLDFALQEKGVHLVRRRRLDLDFKVARLDKRVDVGPAVLRPVVIDDGQGDVLDVHGHGESEQDELEDRRHEEGNDHPLVAEELDELLAEDMSDDDQHSMPQSSLSFKRLTQAASTRTQKPVSSRSSGPTSPNP
jgi:hypothetical protein